jgi:hypothetical protein
MRTPQQINNLRNVFALRYGVPAVFASDEDINSLADRLERQINNKKEIWEIRVRTKENQNDEWEDIEKEPTQPFEYYDIIAKKAQELLEKFPAIIEIGINRTGDIIDINVFKRD